MFDFDPRGYSDATRATATSAIEMSTTTGCHPGVRATFRALKNVTTATMNGVMRVSARTLVIGMMTGGRTAIATHVSTTMTRATCLRAALICPASATEKSSMTPAIANIHCEVQTAARWRRLERFASSRLATSGTVTTDPPIPVTATCGWL